MLISQKERFERYYVKYPDGCWRWTGGTDGGGYGCFYYDKQKTSAHRSSWMIYKGKIPEGMLVLHKCNHRWCVNPDHLYIGTHSDNRQDYINSDAYVRGIVKLDVDDVVCIKKMLRDKIPRWLIAWIYQVSKGSIEHIKLGLNWSSVKI